MTTKTQRDLNLEYWGRVHDMCDAYNKQHGTSTSPKQCVKLDWELWQSNLHPVFGEDPNRYSLAVAIIDGKPVFVGDKVYYKPTGAMAIVPIYAPEIAPDNWTLTPPKKNRTFELNGQQLPCPSTDDNCLLEILGEFYYFESIEDRNKVAKAINDLLVNARAKA